MRILKLAVVAAMALYTLGCSFQSTVPNMKDDTTEAREAAQPNVEMEETSTTVSQGKDTVFRKGDTIPLLAEGKLYGWLKINQVEKLGISDWGKRAVVKNSVKYSYSINTTITLATPLGTGQEDTITVSPYLMKGKKKIGVPCTVGWSGFPKEASFYDNTSSVWTEIGLQPLVKSIPEGAKLVLKVSNAQGTKFDTINLSMSLLDKAKKGRSLRTDKQATVTYSNGAKVGIGVRAVCLENCYDSLDEVHDDNGAGRYYVFKYTTKYKSGATNKSEVSSFDKSSGKYSPKLVMALTSEVDQTELRTYNAGAVWLAYSDREEWLPFATKVFNPIKVGKTASVLANRKLSDTTTKPTKVRFSVEFPEEVTAMSNEELLKFDGRFLVFQKSIEERVLPSYE